MTLFINLLLVTAGFNFVDTSLLSDFVGINSEGEIQSESDSIASKLPQTGEDSSFVQDTTGGGSLSLIDGLGALLDFVGLLFNVVLAPLQLFIEMPNIARVFVGFPLLVFNIFGYASFIRSGA